MTESWFVCSDIHDDKKSLERFVEFSAANNASRNLVLGDLSLRPYSKEALEQVRKDKDILKFIGSVEEKSLETLEGMKAVLESSGTPYGVIPGNYDVTPVFEHVFGDQSLHKKVGRLGDSTIAGYGGANVFPQHIYDLAMLGVVEMFEPIDSYALLTEHRPDVILSHVPPWGLCDVMHNGKHAGSGALRQHIMDAVPYMVLAGHIHESGPLGGNPEGCQGIVKRTCPRTGEVTWVFNPGNLGRFEVVNPKNLDPAMEFDYGTFIRLDVEDNKVPKHISQYQLDTSGTGVNMLREYDL